MSSQKFAEILKMLLRETKTSGANLGRKIGVSKEAISQYCQGNMMPKADKFMKIAEYFDVPPEFLLTGTEAQYKKEYQELKLSGSVVYYLRHCASSELDIIDQLLNHEMFSIIVKLAVRNIELGVVTAEDVIEKTMYAFMLAASPATKRALDDMIISKIKNFKYQTLVDEPIDESPETSDN